jgi:alpha-L-arabinofuranosidase
MRLLGVGNEQWGEQYIERYKVMSKALKEKHPEITLISDPGPSPDGEMFEYLWGELRKLNADIVDEHYYQNPSWFLNNVKRYDNYDRKGPKVFAGEYAVQTVATTSPDNKNNWQSALSEAAYMTGLERNADIVYMASYAPLFAHSEGWQWTPDLIWFDNLHVYGTPNYYVQKLFSTNKGTQVLPLLYQDKPVTGQDSLYASAVIDKNTREIIVKIVNTSNKTQTGKVIIETAKELSSKAKVLILKSNKLDEMNSFDNPKQISPVEELINVSGKEVSISLTPYSFSVFRVALL